MNSKTSTISDKCEEEDSNLHGSYPTSTSRLRINAIRAGFPGFCKNVLGFWGRKGGLVGYCNQLSARFLADARALSKTPQMTSGVTL